MSVHLVLESGRSAVFRLSSQSLPELICEEDRHTGLKALTFLGNVPVHLYLSYEATATRPETMDAFYCVYYVFGGHVMNYFYAHQLMTSFTFSRHACEWNQSSHLTLGKKVNKCI